MFTPCVIIVLIMALAMGLTTTSPTPEPSLTQSPPSALPLRSLRLPNDTYPLGYQLHISSNIHLGVWLFNGNATIDIEIRRSTNEIVLHSKNLSNIQITMWLLDNDRPDAVGERVDDLTHTYDSQGTFLIIHPLENYQAFEAGQRYRLEILYTGVMGTRPNGLYWMEYEEPSTNHTVYVAATQAEPTYARLIFPCYDEPAFKSNYTIRLTHSSGLMAVSNMPVQTVQNHGHLTTTTFQTSPPMSTYLVAFVISNFECITETHRGVTQSIYSSPTRKSTGRGALENAVETVAKLEDYFGVSYPLPKLDHVALKRNQGAAMENWGLITFKEDAILPHDERIERTHVKDRLVSNHEISHQWFGNLVSPEWWTYVWMNEGFATYFGYVVTDLLNPNDHVMDIFLTDEADYALSDSAFIVPRPMTHYVETEPDIMRVFDVVSYKRAACVIKMFHHAFRQKTFVSGISQYLKKFQYSVVNELDLFDALQSAILEDGHFHQHSWIRKVRDIMLSWTHSEWMPRVSVIRNYENNTVTFRQRSIHQKSELWWIPLNFATSQSPSFEHTHVDYFMEPVSEQTHSLYELHLELDGRDWLIVNKQQTGVYHVIYDTDNLQAIARQLQKNHSVIHAINRAALFQDLAPVIEGNEIESIEVVFELFKYLEFEEHLLPWHRVSNTIDYLFSTLSGTVSHSLFKQFVRRLVAPSFERFFQRNESTSSHMDNMVISDILQIACKADLPECVHFTRRLTYDYMFRNMTLYNDFSVYSLIHDTTHCEGLRHQSDDEFNNVLKLLSTTDRDTMLYDDITYALRCTQHHRHMLQYLNLLLGKNSTYSIMDQRAALTYLRYVFKSNIAARSVIWHFIDSNYKQLARSNHFIQIFNEISEYVPDIQKSHFEMVRQNIEEYMQSEHLNSKALLEKNCRRVGTKMRDSEKFLEKFEHQIYNWLLKEMPQTESEKLYAASLSVGNGSDRPGSILRSASNMIKSALRVNLSL